uniref:RETRotransposonlike family member (Retr1)like [Saccoglossus kowalevskii] n=1 Tax=Lepeophtheirus salmonis TaxID=72036 RepID=A0A0K2T298_LEPSM
MRMKLMRYSLTSIHVPGKILNTAGTLSQSPMDNKEEYSFYEELELYANHILEEIPVTNSKLEEIMHHQQEDEVCKQILIYASEGWPDKHLVQGLVGLYYAY